MASNKQGPSKKRPYNEFIKYSAVGFQMLATVLLGVFAGQYLDGYFELEQPMFTLILSLLFIFAAIWLAVKDFIK